jgi:hypothetical protein
MMQICKHPQCPSKSSVLNRYLSCLKTGFSVPQLIFTTVYTIFFNFKNKKKMRTTIIRFTTLILLIILSFYFFNKPKKDLKPMTRYAVSVADNGERTVVNLTEIYNVSSVYFDKWLDSIHLDKPKRCYLAILEKMYESLSADSCNAYKDFLFINKDVFERFINGFKILPLKDKYMMAYAKELTIGLPPVFALFDKNDSLQALTFNFCANESYHNMRLEDWNKEGTLALLIERHKTQANYKKEEEIADLEVYDFTSLDHQIIKVFDHNLYVSYNNLYSEVASTTDNKISFEQPDLIKVTVRKTYKTHFIEAESAGYDATTYANRLQAQEDYLAKYPSDTSFVEYFQRDKVSKIYVKRE